MRKDKLTQEHKNKIAKANTKHGRYAGGLR